MCINILYYQYNFLWPLTFMSSAISQSRILCVWSDGPPITQICEWALRYLIIYSGCKWSGNWCLTFKRLKIQVCEWFPTSLETERYVRLLLFMMSEFRRHVVNPCPGWLTSPQNQLVNFLRQHFQCFLRLLRWPWQLGLAQPCPDPATCWEYPSKDKL